MRDSLKGGGGERKDNDETSFQVTQAPPHAVISPPFGSLSNMSLDWFCLPSVPSVFWDPGFGLHLSIDITLLKITEDFCVKTVIFQSSIASKHL